MLLLVPLLIERKVMFSKGCEYGIRAAIFIAQQSLLGRKVSLREITTAIDTPESFTSKILQQLSRNNIINSEKGPNGGFSMDNHKLLNVKLCSIVSAIDGDEVYMGCGLGLKKCNAKMPCPVHDQFKIIRDELRKMLETTTIKALATDLNSRITFLKR